MLNAVSVLCSMVRRVLRNFETRDAVVFYASMDFDFQKSSAQSGCCCLIQIYVMLLRFDVFVIIIISGIFL